jgi:hypothetical protein
MIPALRIVAETRPAVNYPEKMSPYQLPEAFAFASVNKIIYINHYVPAQGLIYQENHSSERRYS